MTEAEGTGTDGATVGQERQGSDAADLDAVDDPAGAANNVRGGVGNLPEVPDVPAEDVPKPDPDKDQG